MVAFRDIATKIISLIAVFFLDPIPGLVFSPALILRIPSPDHGRKGGSYPNVLV
jgi:hypothetical protein